MSGRWVINYTSTNSKKIQVKYCNLNASVLLGISLTNLINCGKIYLVKSLKLKFIYNTPFTNFTVNQFSKRLMILKFSFAISLWRYHSNSKIQFYLKIGKQGGKNKLMNGLIFSGFG